MNLFVAWIATLVLAWVSMPAVALERFVLSMPGPHALSFLPVELIPRMGADQEQGIALQIVYTESGATALRQLVMRNADFAVAGIPAVMSSRAAGNDVVILAPVDHAPVFVLMVRANLHDQIKSIADLKGKIIAVNAGSAPVQSTSEQLLKQLLASNGVGLDAVHIVPTGQNWRELSALILSDTVDAIMGNEPFASRLQKAGLVFFLENETLHAPGLYITLATRQEVMTKTPNKVATMVHMLQKSLAWIGSHTHVQLIDTLSVTDPEERDALIQVLQQHPDLFSRDGRFSTRQMHETEQLFPLYHPLLEGMINERWAGRSP